MLTASSALASDGKVPVEVIRATWEFEVILPDQELKNYAIPDAPFEVPIKMKGGWRCFVVPTNHPEHPEWDSRSIICSSKTSAVETFAMCSKITEYDSASLQIQTGQDKSAPIYKFRINCRR